MKKPISIKFLTAAALAAAASSAAAEVVVSPVRYLPERPDIVCNHLPCPGPEDEPRFGIMRGLDRGASAISRTIENRDMNAASANLDGLFEGGAFSEAPVVAAFQGDAPRGRTQLLMKSGNPAVVRVGWKGCAAGALANGAAGCGIGSAAEDGFNEGMDRLGNYLRDRNDDKLNKR